MSKDLNPEIVGMDLANSMHYSKNRATVKFEISDGNGGRENLTVEYPVQNDRHLTMLMTNKDTGKTPSLPVAKELSEAIKTLVEPKEDNGDI